MPTNLRFIGKKCLIEHLYQRMKKQHQDPRYKKIVLRYFCAATSRRILWQNQCLWTCSIGEEGFADMAIEDVHDLLVEK